MIKKLLEEFLSKKLLMGFGGVVLLASSGLAQDSNAPTVLKPTVVTGSYIPQSEGATVASPVDIVTSQQILEAGQQDIVYTLKLTNPNFAGSGNIGAELNNNSSNPGEGNVALRNLPTLVLLNGRRIANTALSRGTAVDVYTLPLSMIERIEILKDGASALYGSDAIGGVVNVITKKNYNGAEVSGRYGFATGKGNVTEERATAVGGVSTETTRIFVGADYYHADPIKAKDREVSSASALELAQQRGGEGVGITPPTYYSGSYPGRVGNFVLAGSPLAQGAPGYNPAITFPPTAGGPYTLNQLVAQGVYIPISSTPLGEFTGTTTILNTTEAGPYAQAEQERRNAFGNIEHNIFEDKLVVFGNFLFADNTYTTQLAPAPVSALGPAGQNQIGVPADNVYNPFGVPLGTADVTGTAGGPRVRTRLYEVGNRTSVNESTYYNFVGGLRGDINEHLSYEGAYTYSLSSQVLQNRNAANGIFLNQALTPIGATNAAGLPLSALTDPGGNPLPLYNIFALPGFNSPQTLQAIRTSVFERGRDQLWGVDGHIGGMITEIPAGKLGYAIGGGFLEERLSIDSDGLLQSGNAVGYNPNPTFSGGKRTRSFGFAQVEIPVTSPDWNIPGFYSFKITAAGRIEHLEPGGDSEVPQIGLAWKPLDEQVTLRGTFSEGFVAPPLFDLFGPTTPNNPTVNIRNPVLGNGAGQVSTLEAANAVLPPAESVNWDLGITIKPKILPNLTVTVDYYNIDEEGVPALPDYNQAIASLNSLGSGSPYASGFRFANNSRLTTTAPNQIAFQTGNPANEFGVLQVQYQPDAAQRTDGIDLGATYLFPTENWGSFTLGANANLIRHFQFRLNKASPFYEYSGQYTSPSSVGGAEGTLPDWYLTDSLTWNFKGLTVNAASRFVPEVLDVGDMFPTAGNDVNSHTYNGKPWTVSSWYSIDLQVAYRFDESYGRWLNGTRVAVGCNNITDNTPPFISSGSEDNTDKQMYSILGRFVYFEVSKKF